MDQCQLELELIGGAGSRPSRLSQEQEYHNQQYRQAQEARAAAAAAATATFWTGQRVAIRVGRLYPWARKNNLDEPNSIMPPKGMLFGTVIGPTSSYYGEVKVILDVPVKYREKINNKYRTVTINKMDFSYKRLVPMDE